jgi:hypothetical protein
MGPLDREHADAWATDFIDVETLNARPSDLILKAIDEVRDTSRRAPSSLRSHSLLVLGPAGAGKTHLFARIRRRCGPRAAFVLMRPELASDPTPRHVLAAYMDALQQRVPGRDDRQLDLVIGSALAMLEGHGVKWPNAFLEQVRSASATERADMLAEAVERIADLFPEANLDWVERLLSVPVLGPAERRAALVWLSGREPDANQLKRLGLNEMMPDQTVLPALRTLVFLASYSTPSVLVFDQLENLIDHDDPSAARIHAHARLVSELFDSVRGLVIVQLALDAEWARRIQPVLSASERSRLEARIEVLELPTPAQRTELLERWVESLPPEDRQPAPWPFSPEEWSRWRTAAGATPRMLMIACRQALGRPALISDLILPSAQGAPSFPQEDSSSTATDERLAEQWAELMQKAQVEVSGAAEAGHPLDRERVLGAVIAATGLAGTIKVERGRAKTPFDLRAHGPAGPVDILVVQQAHPRSVASALQRAATAASSTRTIALREQGWPFPPTWSRVGELLEAFTKQARARWLELGQPQVVELLALHDFMAAARSSDLSDERGAPLSEERAREWARQALRPESHPVIATLFDPSVAASPSEETPLAAEVPPQDDAQASPVVPPRGKAREALEPQGRGVVIEVLSRLQLASVDRLVREVRQVDTGQTRSRVLEAVQALGPQVRWLGRSIVAWKGGGS